MARLLIVPVNTSICLTCEVCYNEAYSVEWYRDNTIINSTATEESHRILNYTLFVTSEYKNTQILCVISPHLRNSDTIPSNTIILNAVAEGKFLILWIILVALPYYYFITTSWSGTKSHGWASSWWRITYFSFEVVSSLHLGSIPNWLLCCLHNTHKSQWQYAL